MKSKQSKLAFMPIFFLCLCLACLGMGCLGLGGNGGGISSSINVNSKLSISGRAYFSERQLYGNIPIVIKNFQKEIVSVTTTDSSGYYSVSDLTPGIYYVAATTGESEVTFANLIQVTDQGCTEISPTALLCVKDVIIDKISSDSFHIDFHTNRSCRASLEYGPTGGFQRTKTIGQAGQTHHETTITGLNFLTDYEISIHLTGDDGQEFVMNGLNASTIGLIGCDNLSVNINSGEYETNSQNVTLYLNAEKCTQMRISESYLMDDANWLNYSPTYSYTFTNPSTGIKRIFVQFKNSEGTISPTQSDSIVYTSSGYIGIWINDGEAVTNQPMINIKAIYPDATQMVISDNSSFSNAFWESYSPNRKWNIAGEDGIKYIYCKFKGGKANPEEVFKASIIYDTTPSVVDMIINDGSNVTSSATVTINFMYSSLPSQMKISNTEILDIESNSGWEPFKNNIKWHLPDGDGTKTVYAAFKDSASNIYGPIQSNIEIDTAPPIGNSIAILKSDNPSSEKIDFSLVEDLPIYLHFNIQDESTNKILYHIGLATNTIPTDYLDIIYPFNPIELKTNNLKLGNNKIWAYFLDEAGNKGFVQTAQVQIEGPEIQVTPSKCKLKSGQNRTFIAEIKNINPEEVGSITWTIVSGSGTIDENGVYTAPSPLFYDETVTIKGASKLQPDLFCEATIELFVSPEIVYIDSNGLQTKEPLITQITPTDTAYFQIYLLHNSHGIKITSSPSVGTTNVSTPIENAFGSIATISYQPPADSLDTKTINISFSAKDDSSIIGNVTCVVSTGPSITLQKSAEIAQRHNPIKLVANITNSGPVQETNTVSWSISPATAGSFSPVNSGAQTITTTSAPHEVTFYPFNHSKITAASITANIGIVASKTANLTIYPPIGVNIEPIATYSMPIPVPMLFSVSNLEYLTTGTNEDLIWEFKNANSADFMPADGKTYADRGTLTILSNNQVQYLRPTKLPSTMGSSVTDEIIIRATSAADPLASSTSRITLAPKVVVELFDNVEKTNKVATAATVIEVGSLQFYSKVTPEIIGNTTVTWTVTGGSSSNLGIVDSNGKYTAPDTIDTNKVYLRATSNYDPSAYAEIEISLSEFWVPKRDNLVDSLTGEPMPISTIFVDPNTKTGEDFIVFAGTSAENKFGYYGLWVATFSDNIGDTNGGYWKGIEGLHSSTKNPDEKYLIYAITMANNQSIYVSTGDGIYHISKLGSNYKAEKCTGATNEIDNSLKDALPIFSIDTMVENNKTKIIAACHKGVYIITFAEGSRTTISNIEWRIDTESDYLTATTKERRTETSGTGETATTQEAYAYPNTSALNPIKSIVRSLKYDSLNKSLYFGTESNSIYFANPIKKNTIENTDFVFTSSTGLSNFRISFKQYPDLNYPKSGTLTGIPLSIAIDPINTNTIWTATTSGVSRSTDYGSSWSSLNFGGGTTTNCRAIIVDPNNTINVMAGSEDGLYRTINGGSSWTRIKSGLGNYKTITCLTQGSGAASQRRKVWVGTSGGVFIGKQSLALE